MKKYKYLASSTVLVILFTISTNTARGDSTASIPAETQIKLSAQAVLKTRGDAMQTAVKTERAQMQAKIDALKAGVKKEKDGIKAKIEESRIAGRENALARFNGAVEKINNLNDRVSAQITKLEAKGVDVTNAKNFETIVETK